MEEIERMELWPGWKTVQLIGSGSFGEVYEIERSMEGLDPEKAAVKRIPIPQDEREIDTLRTRGYGDTEIAEYYKKRLLEILKEYKVTAELKDHPNIVGCDDIRYEQRADGIGWDVFVRMELLMPLTRVKSSFTNERQVARLGREILKALIQCEKNGIVHRDIKPQNIFVTKNGEFKLGDIGIAKMTDRMGTQPGVCEFTAPEVYEGKPYGSTADIYSLGLVLYWMLNERRSPFVVLPPEVPNSADKENALKRRLGGETIPSPVHGSDELCAIVLKACEFDPNDRYQNAQEMLDALEAFAKSGINGLINGERNPGRVIPVSVPEPVAEEAKGTIPADLFGADDAETSEEDEKEPKLKKKQKTLLIVVAAILLLLVTVVIASIAIWSCSGKNTEHPVTQPTAKAAEITAAPETSAPTATAKPTAEPTATPKPTATPTPAPTIPSYFMFGGQRVIPGQDAVEVEGQREALIRITQKELDQLVQYCPELERLSLDYCYMDDYSKIGELTSLYELQIMTTGNAYGGVKMTDISWISSLTNLMRLSLCHNAISDISGLEGLIWLERLNLADNLIEGDSLKYLTDLDALQFLYLYNNPELSDVSYLSSLESLQTLHIGGCRKITDISMLTDLPRLKELNIGYDDKITFEYFKNFKVLETLWLQGCSANRDYSGLASCSKLKRIYIYSNDTKLKSALRKALPKMNIIEQG